MQAMIYARTSGSGQSKDETIRGQVDACLGYCERSGITVSRILTDDGISGATLDRPGIQELLSLARSGDVSRVVVWRSDRFSRDTEDLLQCRRELEELGVEVLSVTEASVKGSFGRFVATVNAGVSEYEREKIRERTYETGRIERARRGEWMNGRYPYGYERNDDRSSLQFRHLRVVESEAEVLRLAMRLLLQGHTQTETADELNKLNHRQRSGAPWRNKDVVRCITNPACYGMSRFTVWPRRSKTDQRNHQTARYQSAPSERIVIKGAHPAILSEADLDALGWRLDAKHNPTRRQSRRLLTGILACDACGSMFKAGGTGNSKAGRYECTGCRVSVDRAKADDEVWEKFWVVYTVEHVTEVHSEAAKACDEELASADAEKADAMASLASVERRLRNVASEIAEHGGTDALRALGAELEESRTFLERRIVSLSEKRDAVEELPDDVGEFLADMRADLEASDEIDRRRWLRDTCERVVLGKPSRGVYEYRFELRYDWVPL